LAAKPAPTQSAPTRALIAHLSEEIQAQVAAMTAWRTRVNFTAFFGPWIILGGYVALEKVTPCAPDLSDTSIRLALGGLVAVYLAFGLGCALVEQGVWKQCNKWRALIGRLHRDKEMHLTNEDLEFRHVLKRSYLAVYALMIVGFWLGTFLIGKCTKLPPEPAQEAPPPNTAPATPGPGTPDKG